MTTHFPQNETLYNSQNLDESIYDSFTAADVKFYTIPFCHILNTLFSGILILSKNFDNTFLETKNYPTVSTPLAFAAC